MRYSIDFDKLVNKLVPHYIGGRKLILYLQALLKPLQATNDAFRTWAEETRIEAAMTSQIFKFEWFLNRRFSKYFLDSSQRITIGSNIGSFGTPMYNENTSLVDPVHVRLYGQNESGTTSAFYNDGERTEAASCSFVVNVPPMDTAKISQNEYLAMLKYQIDKYKLAGKTYIITINNETL